MCEYLLRRFNGSMLKDWYYVWLLPRVLFEYCIALNLYNKECNW